MAGLEDIPELSDHGFVLVLLLLLTFWVYVKVNVLRKRLALREPGDSPPKAPAWQHALARSPCTFPILGILALVIVGTIVVLLIT